MVIHDFEYVGDTDCIFTDELREWCLWYWTQLPDKKDNGQKFVSLTYFDLPYNLWFKTQLENIIYKMEPDSLITHATLHEDYLPGGIHSDGEIETYKEPGEISRTYLFPLFISEETYSLVFHQKSKKALSLNQILGLGNAGIIDYKQTTAENIGLDITHPFNKSVWEKYLTHLDYSACAGLTTAAVLKWKLGHGITWPRENLHTSANFPKMKRQFLLVETCKK